MLLREEIKKWWKSKSYDFRSNVVVGAIMTVIVVVVFAFIFGVGGWVQRRRMENCHKLFPQYTEQQCRFQVSPTVWDVEPQGR